MMKDLLIEVEENVFSFLNAKLKGSYVYHNISHTQRVVEKTKELIEGLKIEGDAAVDLIIASWFHDTGYTEGPENHEDRSVQIATIFLKEKSFPEPRIQHISALIMATKMGSEPKTDFEKIIKDADLAHIGSKSFDEESELLRKEWDLTKGKKLTASEWVDVNIEFFTKKHKFYSDFAIKNWSKRKNKNLATLLKQKNKINQENKKFHHKQEVFKLKKVKGDVPERGVETMFRVALRNHMTLSDIADTKANILLSVNAIIVSLALSNLLPKLDNPSNSHLLVPTIIFIVFTVASIILSITATRPNVTEGKFSREDVANKKVNLLFFGNFHQMKLDDFEWGISEMMNDRDYLYSSLTKDLYFLGLVLNRKYKILRLTYTVFMIGIIVSVLAFITAFSIQATAS